MLGLVDNSKGLYRSENVHFDGTVAQLFLELRLLHSAGDGECEFKELLFRNVAPVIV